MRYKCNEPFDGLIVIWIPNAQNGQERRFALKNMCCVPKAVRVAQEMGQGLG
jgi:hypothetical protein